MEIKNPNDNGIVCSFFDFLRTVRKYALDEFEQKYLPKEITNENNAPAPL